MVAYRRDLVVMALDWDIVYRFCLLVEPQNVRNS